VGDGLWFLLQISPSPACCPANHAELPDANGDGVDERQSLHLPSMPKGMK
jgi:hypothetical protein